jgi:hypothetical protein
MSTDPAEWFRNIPPITKTLFVGSLAVTLAGGVCVSVCVCVCVCVCV